MVGTKPVCLPNVDLNHQTHLSKEKKARDQREHPYHIMLRHDPLLAFA